MKYTLLLVAILVATRSFCQDTIIKTNGYVIPCRVLWADHYKVHYKHRVTDTLGHMYVLADSVYMIKYANGQKSFNKKLVQDTNTLWHFDEMSMVQRAKCDADEYYAGWRGAKAASAWGGFLIGPVLGLIPTFATASKQPKDKRLGCPAPELMKNADYAQAYRHEAHKIKRKKAWNGYALGVFLDVAFGVLLVI